MRDHFVDVGVLHVVLNRSADMITISEGSERVLYINPSGLALLGVTELSLVEAVTVNDFTRAGLSVAGELQLGLRSANRK